MPTSLKAISRQMLALNGALGRAEPVTALATGSVTAGALAYGGSPSKYIDRYAMRRDATSAADRIRRISNFTSSTGLMAHGGANYADTTTTDETVEIWEHDPKQVDNAINITLLRLRHQDRTELPTYQNQRRTWLSDCSWILEPGDVTRVCWSDNPVISRNRYFEKQNAYNSSGVLTPDFWAISGASATMARSTTQNRRGQYSLAITRAGTDCLVSQSVTYLANGVSGEDLRGQTVTAVLVCLSAVASQIRVQINDGITTTSSSYHTGGSVWEELTVSAAIAAAATNVTIRVSVETSNTVCYADEAYALEATALTDDVRRDNWNESEVDPGTWEQAGTLNVHLPERARRGQWVIYSQRGYPQLDATRFAAGTADADVIDADVLKVATGAIGRLYEMLSSRSPEDGQKYGPMAADWNSRFRQLAAGHTVNGSGMKPGGAANAVLRPLAHPAVRW